MLINSGEITIVFVISLLSRELVKQRSRTNYRKDLMSQRGLRKVYFKLCTVVLLNKAGRDKFPFNPKYVGSTGNRTRDNWLSKCILSDRYTIWDIGARSPNINGWRKVFFQVNLFHNLIHKPTSFAHSRHSCRTFTR